MKWRIHEYDVPIYQDRDLSRLAELSALEADEAADSEFLAGNQMYTDMRGFTWADVERVMAIEADLISRFQQADDLEVEAQIVDEERARAIEFEQELWGLDIGVAAATVALSALGAIPAGSCNAGGFGGDHQASYPYVAFFASQEVGREILTIAIAAGVGLGLGSDGIARLFGRTDIDLFRFASVAIKRR